MEPTQDLLDGLQKQRRKNADLHVRKRAVKKMEKPGVNRKGNNLTMVGLPCELGDIDRMLRDRGLNPDEWFPVSSTVNEWEAGAMVDGEWMKTTLHQLKIQLKLRSSILLPAPIACSGHAYALQDTERVDRDMRLIAILPDQQVRGPGEGYDPVLLEIALRWIEINRPDEIIFSGDLPDMNALSRWERKADVIAGLQREVDATHNYLAVVRSAAGPAARIRWIKGNHEGHWERELRKRIPEIADLHVAGEGESFLTLANLVNTDAIGVECIPTDWPHGEIKLSKYLAVRHGWIVRQNSGASAHKTLDYLGYSVIVGHTHRQGIVYQTKHEMPTKQDPHGRQRVTCAIESGTMAQISGGLGYVVAPDWQNGWSSVYVAPDGTFSPIMATMVNDTLFWGSQRFSYKRGKVQIAA